MKTFFCALLSLLVACAFAGCATDFKNTRHSDLRQVGNPGVPVPVLLPGVTELKFSEFFVTPVGPRGLALTDKLTNLDGKRVRMLGYMVHRDAGLPGQFLFSALPVQLHDHDSSDDLPAALVHVSVPTCREQPVPHAPGLMLLTGTLSVGHREEADGRMSVVRLVLDPPTAPAQTNRSSVRKGDGFKSARASSAH